MNLVHAPARPGVHRRIHVAERPLIRRDLPVRMHVPLAQKQSQLPHGEFGIHHRQRNRVERQIPGRVPRVFPLVGHGDHVFVVQVDPLRVAAHAVSPPAASAGPDPLEPRLDHEMIKLLGPQQPREGLPLDPFAVFRERPRTEGVEFVGLGDPFREQPVEVRFDVRHQPRCIGHTRQAQTHDRGLPGLELERVPGAGLGAGLLRIHRLLPAFDDALVKRILHVRARVFQAPQRLGVGLIFGKQQRRISVQREPVGAQVLLLGVNRSRRHRGAERVSVLSDPTSRYCGTRASAAGAASRPRARDSPR